jgi:hypothetical protein
MLLAGKITDGDTVRVDLDDTSAGDSRALIVTRSG